MVFSLDSLSINCSNDVCEKVRKGTVEHKPISLFAVLPQNNCGIHLTDRHEMVAALVNLEAIGETIPCLRNVETKFQHYIFATHVSH
jgi:hypothetical protein